MTPAEQLELKLEPIVDNVFSELINTVERMATELIEKGITDEDALEYAKSFDDDDEVADTRVHPDSGIGPAFAAILRHVPARRAMISVFAKVEAVFEAYPEVKQTGASFEKIGELYATLPKGST